MIHIYRLVAFMPVLLLCSCMASVNLKVMRPAQLTIEQHIRKVAVVNRTIPESKAANIAESILTGELIGQDKRGIQNAMNGIQENLRDSPRFEMILTNEELKGSGSGTTFPAPLNWNIVSEICRKYQADAILTIETYDSDFIVTKGTKNVKKVTEKGDTIIVPEYYAEGIGSVNVGYRLYDPQKKTIVDQFQSSSNNRWYAVGASIQDALGQLIDASSAIQRVSYATGLMYGARISPSWYTVNREFYKKPKENTNLAIGARKAIVNDWSGAADYWTKAVQSGNTKVAGRAAYNVALAYEVLGDLDNAKKWITIAYADYGNKKSRAYARILDGRLWEREKLAQQLQNQ